MNAHVEKLSLTSTQRYSKRFTLLLARNKGRMLAVLEHLLHVH